MQDGTTPEKYSEKYIIRSGILNGTDIPAGKGSITVDSHLARTLEGKLLVLDLSLRKGPCPDDMCQINMDIDAKIVQKVEKPSGIDPQEQGFSLAIDREVFRSIDKGREHIIIKGKAASVTVKGFTFTN